MSYIDASIFDRLSSASMSINEEQLKMEVLNDGWLYKKESSESQQSWKKRFFVLNMDFLMFFKDEKRDKMLGKMTSKNLSFTSIGGDGTKKFAFVTYNQTIYVRGDSVDIKDDWKASVFQLRKKIEDIKNSEPGENDIKEVVEKIEPISIQEEKPVEKSVEKQEEISEEKSEEKPIEKPAEKPIEKSDKKIEKSTSKSKLKKEKKNKSKFEEKKESRFLDRFSMKKRKSSRKISTMELESSRKSKSPEKTIVVEVKSENPNLESKIKNKERSENITLSAILNDPMGTEHFLKFLETEYSHYQCFFWLGCRDYIKKVGAQEDKGYPVDGRLNLLLDSIKLCESYVVEGKDETVNIPISLREPILRWNKVCYSFIESEEICNWSTEYAAEIFDDVTKIYADAQMDVIKMLRGSCRRFKKSVQFRNLTEALANIKIEKAEALRGSCTKEACDCIQYEAPHTVDGKNCSGCSHFYEEHLSLDNDEEKVDENENSAGGRKSSMSDDQRRKLKLLLGVSVSNMDNYESKEEKESRVRFLYDKISMVVNSNTDPLVLKNQRFLLKKYHDCFIGKKLVEKLRKQLNISKSETISIAGEMMDNDIIKPIDKNQSEFINGKFYYQLTKESKKEIDGRFLNAVICQDNDEMVVVEVQENEQKAETETKTEIKEEPSKSTASEVGLFDALIFGDSESKEFKEEKGDNVEKSGKDSKSEKEENVEKEVEEVDSDSISEDSEALIEKEKSNKKKKKKKKRRKKGKNAEEEKKREESLVEDKKRRKKKRKKKKRSIAKDSSKEETPPENEDEDINLSFYNIAPRLRQNSEKEFKLDKSLFKSVTGDEDTNSSIKKDTK